MPTYEYTCSGCGHDWEAFQSIKDAPLTECPSCGAPKAKRQVSLGGGFILKGGGWYSDLYSSQPNKGKSTQESSAPPTTTGPSPKTDSTPKADSTPKESSKPSGSGTKSKASSSTEHASNAA